MAALGLEMRTVRKAYQLSPLHSVSARMVPSKSQQRVTLLPSLSRPGSK
jgi:hypothetical protein